MSILRKRYYLLINSYLKLWVRTLKLILRVVPRWTVFWIILLLIQGFIPGATVYLTKLTIDSFTATKNDLSQLNNSIVLLVLTGTTLLLSEVIQVIIEWVRVNQADILTDYLKGLIHEKASQVDFEFYESSSYHDLLEQVRGNSISKPLALLESFGSILQSLVTLLIFSSLLIIYAWWLPLVLLFGGLPALYIYLNSEQVMHNWVKSTTPSRRLLIYFETLLTNNIAAAEMRAFSLNKFFDQRYQSLSLQLRTEKMLHFRKQLVGKLFAAILALFTASVALGWMALRVLYNSASLGDLAVFYQVFSRGQSLTQSLLGGVNKLFSNTIYLENLFEFLDLQPKITTKPDAVPFPEKLQKGIKFSNLGFTYPGAEKPSLKNFDLFIPAGKIAAIVGVNGAGKSTLVKLLYRFYELDQGSIEIDGIDTRDFDIADLRNNLATYFQFPLQFHETVSDNIAFGNISCEPKDEEVESAARLAGAEKFIKKLPSQYKTQLGKHFADGYDLSGGEWQRLALSRSYYRKSQIIILDEPTSFMDPWSEDYWFKQLRQLAQGRTGFVITHRFTIAMRADIIHVVDDGKVIESGSHQSLLELNGFYAASWKSQMQISQDG